MFTDCVIYLSQAVDPYLNLGFEEYLCRSCGAGLTVFLWQNSHTVVIGRNQNPWRECALPELLRSGGRLARRSTGGGAVYHDMGNLNYSFVFKADKPLREPGYEIIRQSVESFGIACSLTGRNDLTVSEGRKFSGSAFRYEDGVFLHHGTLLISSDLEKVDLYLRPSFQKMESKGVKSVSARVINLSRLNSDISIDSMKRAITGALSRLVGKPRICYSEPNDETNAIAREYASDEWIYGVKPESNLTLFRRFDWGELELFIHIKDGYISSVKAYTDALSPSLPEGLERAFLGERLGPGRLSGRTALLAGEYFKDISEWLKEEAL